MKTRIVVPSHIVQIQPRLIGSGSAIVWVDQFAVVPRGSFAAQPLGGLSATLMLHHSALDIAFHTAEATLPAGQVVKPMSFRVEEK